MTGPTRSAILSIILSGREIDLPVSWADGYDTDAVIRMPQELRNLWMAGTRIVLARRPEGDVVRPYPTMPMGVPLSSLRRSATGFFAIASEVSPRVYWKVSPPYPPVVTLSHDPLDVY